LVAGLAAIAGLGCWWLMAATSVERAAFGVVLGSYVRPPFLLTGDGSRAAAWKLRTRSLQARPDERQAPVVVSIGDDAGGVFQASPPSPVDLAVVLRNLQRLGAKQAAIAAVMAWEKPDAVSLKGLEIVLDGFQSVIHAAPLSRGTARQAMPPAFRRAALAPEAIQGDLSRLPIVNRVPVADVIFSKGKATMAGFSSLDDADGGDGMLPLLARWEEENAVVLAFPLLAALVRYDLPVAGVKVKLGQFLRLGPRGPVLPIDLDGRMALPPKALAPRADISAEAVIVGTPEIFPAAPGLIVLRDDQSSATRATRKFSATLASAIASISSDAGLGPPRTYRRLPAAAELAMLMGAVLLLTCGAAWPRSERLLACAILAGTCLAAQWLALGLAQVWLPGIPLLAATGAGTLAMMLLEPAPAPVALRVGRAASHLVGPVTTITGRKFRSVTMRKDELPRQTQRRLEPASSFNPVPTPAPEPDTLWSNAAAVAAQSNPAESTADSPSLPPAGNPRQFKRSAKKHGKRPPGGQS